METEKRQLMELVCEYKFAVKKAIELLNIKSEKDKGFQIEGIGYLDEAKEIRYIFHGVGCLVIAKDFEVDFDFDEEGKGYGIEPWFLSNFLRDNKGLKEKYPLINDGDQIKELLQELENEGIVARDVDKSHWGVFYVLADIHGPVRPIFKPYRPAIWLDDDDY